jgi:hypothetical protein
VDVVAPKYCKVPDEADESSKHRQVDDKAGARKNRPFLLADRDIGLHEVLWQY